MYSVVLMGTEVEQRSKGQHQHWRVGTVNMASAATVNYSSFPRSLLAANAEMMCMKDDAERFLDSAQSFKGLPIISSYHYICLFWQAAMIGNQCVSPQQGGETAPASVDTNTGCGSHVLLLLCMWRQVFGFLFSCQRRLPCSLRSSLC